MRLRRGGPPGAIVRAWCRRRNQRGRPVSKGSGMTRGDRRRNARRERLRGMLPRDGAVIGIDLADDKQAIAVIDHDVRVLARKTARVKAFRLGEALDWAVGQARTRHIRAFVERAVTFTTCPECGGTRLSEAAR